MFTVSARTHAATLSVATDNFHSGAVFGSAEMYLNASRFPALAAGRSPASAAAGISVSPSNDSVFTATPGSAETATKPVSFAVSSGCTPATGNDFGKCLRFFTKSTFNV